MYHYQSSTIISIALKDPIVICDSCVTRSCACHPELYTSFIFLVKIDYFF